MTPAGLSKVLQSLILTWAQLNSAQVSQIILITFQRLLQPEPDQDAEDENGFDAADVHVDVVDVVAGRRHRPVVPKI